MRCLPATITAALLLLAGVTHGQQLAAGKGEQQVTVLDTTLPVFTYRPAQCEPRVLLAVFHGSNRNAGPYRDAARPLADKLCAIIVSPEFTVERFPDSQFQLGGVAARGVLVPPGRRPVDLVEPLLAWARAASGKPALPAKLLAHSAGAQFVDRVAAFAKTDAVRIVLASPSSYVLPSTGVAVPFGFAGVEPAGRAEAMLRAYLALPIDVLVGTADTGTDGLSMTPEAVAQGANRLMRARTTFAMAQRVAHERNWPFGWHELEAQGAGHHNIFSTREALQSLQ